MKKRNVLNLIVVIALLLGVTAAAVQAAPVERPKAAPIILGPFVGDPVPAYRWDGDLRDLPQIPESLDTPSEVPVRLTPLEKAALTWGFASEAPAPNVSSGPMPPPIMNFAGMQFSQFGAGWPPDTNGDVGPNHYIETVNTSVAIFDKATGTRLVGLTLNNFFTGPAGTPCDTSNDGDPVVLYDPYVDRWIVTNFAWFNFNTGPYYECIAVSQTADPVAGGWYFYALQANTGTFAGDYFNDYPKLGVWSDGYYMSANMFEAVGTGFGVRLWGMNKTPLLTGAPLQEVHFDLCLDGSCGSFLPSNARGTAPPAGAPNYFMQAAAPDAMDLYKFDADWVTPANSTLTGPISIPVDPFGIVDYGIPQQGTGQTLDSLSFRLMMQLQYRNYGSHESLYALHTINQGGRAATRWYEVRNPGGTPTLHQQGTHNLNDGAHRWMGSIAADKDGNIAVGYSVSSGTMYPAIRYAGQRYGEFLGQLPQTETSLIEGTGSQTSINRWGDYSAMTVDPNDDCTFWYTQEYYAASGSNWQTRIGSFKFPACGVQKGTLNGRVYNTVTNAGIPGAPVSMSGPESVTVVTDASGNYSMQVVPGTYSITAGPLLPGYPTSVTVNNRTVAAGGTTTTDIGLVPVPNLIYNATTVNDNVPGGNNNGYLEPGESGIQMFVSLANNGATTSTGISAVLSSSTPGVTISQNTSTYPNIAAGGSANNNTAYIVSVADTVVCGSMLDFSLAVTTAQGNYTLPFSLQASVPQPPTNVFFDDFESGVNGWTTGGTLNTWAQTTEASHSPTHSWTDSPGVNYPNDMNAWLQSPAINLAGKYDITVSGYYKYALEPGFDYTYLEYSTNGGTTWAATPLADFNGVQSTFTQVVKDAAALENQSNVRLRYRITSDGGVVFDGFYVDDFAVSYVPIVCEPVVPTAVELSSVDSATTTTAPTTALLALLAVVALGGVLVLRARRSA